MSHELSILLVEDDPVDAMIVTRAFEKARVDSSLRVACNGVEALELLRGEAAGRDEKLPVLILLDLNLPLMNGHELLAQLKADPRLRRIPVVVLSTSARERDVEECYDRGAAGYVVKPVGFDECVHAMEVIARYWGLSRLARPPRPDERGGEPR
jgi:CheY-like chemotaxis protein